MYMYVYKMYIHKFLNIHSSNGGICIYIWIHEHNALSMYTPGYSEEPCAGESV